MTQQRNLRVLVGAILGAASGIIFGGMTALGAAHGDRAIRSGLKPGLVFLLSFLGWTVSGALITELWRYVHDERSANLVGIVSVAPLVLASLVVAAPRSEIPSVSAFLAFVIFDPIIGIVVGEAAWNQFGKTTSRSDESSKDGSG